MILDAKKRIRSGSFSGCHRLWAAHSGWISARKEREKLNEAREKRGEDPLPTVGHSSRLEPRWLSGRSGVRPGGVGGVRAAHSGRQRTGGCCEFRGGGQQEAL